MALLYGFFNAKDTDQADTLAKYTYEAEDFSRLFQGMFTGGVFRDFGEMFSVKPATFDSGIPRVSVGTGKIWINNKWMINDAQQIVSCGLAPSASPRIDTVLAVLDYENRSFDFRVLNGVPSSTPVHVPDEDLPANSYRIADVRIDPGITSLTQDKITYLVGLTGGAPIITGMLDGGHIDNYVAGWDSKFEQWLASEDSDFEDWLSHLQQELIDQQAATNLQNEIDGIWGYLTALGSAEDRSY